MTASNSFPRPCTTSPPTSSPPAPTTSSPPPPSSTNSHTTITKLKLKIKIIYYNSLPIYISIWSLI